MYESEFFGHARGGLPALLKIGLGASRAIDVDPGGNLHFIANRDAIATEQDTVIVHERPVSDGDVISIIAPNEVRD